jgi:hypothetical protein
VIYYRQPCAKVKDGFRSWALLTMAIMSRRRWQQQGGVMFDSDYESM